MLLIFFFLLYHENLERQEVTATSIPTSKSVCKKRQGEVLGLLPTPRDEYVTRLVQAHNAQILPLLPRYGKGSKLSSEGQKTDQGKKRVCCQYRWTNYCSRLVQEDMALYLPLPPRKGSKLSSEGKKTDEGKKRVCCQFRWT